MSAPPPVGQPAIEDLLAQECRAQGSISFARFMEIALYTAGLGYYESSWPRMGARADFVTAPEISDLFGRCVARQIARLMDESGLGTLIEVGPGSGQLALQVLTELARAGALPDRYVLLERSRALRSIQRAQLAELLPAQAHSRIEWATDLTDLGAAIEGLVFANELLDALPAHRFKMVAGQRRELRVTVRDDGGFEYVVGPFADPSAQLESDRLANDIDSLPDGYESELLTGQVAWIGKLAESLRRGACLLFDYGYPRREFYHLQRTSGTVRCYSGQRRHDDPLFRPGSQDISIHVDFSRVAEVACAGGMRLSGFCDQAHFLMANGLLEALQAGAEAQPGSARYATLAQQARTLMMPGEMGEAVKCLLLTRELPETIQLTTARDQRHRL